MIEYFVKRINEINSSSLSYRTKYIYICYYLEMVYDIIFKIYKEWKNEKINM